MRLFFIAILLIATSCATVIKRSTYKLSVVSPGTDDKVEVEGKIFTLPAKIPVRRSKEDLHIRLISDTTSIDFTVEAYPHDTFLYGNLLFVTACPAGYLIDLTNPRRFHYGRQIVLNAETTPRFIESPVRKSTIQLRNDVREYFEKRFPRQKGDFVYAASFPFMNYFYLQPENQLPRSRRGFLGASVGLEYFHQDNQYFSPNTGTVLDFYPFSKYDSYVSQHMNSTYLTLTNNYQIKRLHVGYGLNLSRNTWRWESMAEDGSPLIPSTLLERVKYIKRVSTGVGLTLNGYYQFTENLHAGVLYRSTLFQFDPTTKWRYEHVMSSVWISNTER